MSSKSFQNNVQNNCKNQTDDRAGKRNGRPGVCGRIPILLQRELSALHPGAFKTYEKGKQGRGRAACRLLQR